MPRRREADPVDPHRKGSRIPTVLLAHPFELALGVALVLNGLRGIAGSPTPSLATLPAIPLALYLVVSTLGGLGLVFGLVYRAPLHNGLGVSIERSSLFLVAAAYAGLGILLVTTNGSAGIGSAVVVGVVASACILRAVAIRRAARVVLDTLRIVNRESDQ